MAGTKRSREITDTKASKKAKIAQEDFQKGKKAASAKAENIDQDFGGFNDEAEQTNHEEIKPKKDKEKYKPTKYIKPKKPEPYPNGMFCRNFLTIHSRSAISFGAT